MVEQRQHGFSLIELLAVIAILTILAAILYPAFAKACDKSTQSSCQENQRQLALSVLRYAGDHHGTLPMPADWMAATDVSCMPQRLICPSAHRKGTPDAPNYGYNGRLFDLVTDGARRVPRAVSLDEIMYPEQVECTLDLRANYRAPRDPNAAQLQENGKPIVYSYDAEGDCRHSDGIVVSYLDGHVEYVTGERVGKSVAAYGIPPCRSYFVDFSQLNPGSTDPARIAAYMLTYLTHTVPVFATRPQATSPRLAGAWNPLTRSWDIPAGACESLGAGAGAHGQSILLDLSMHGSTIAQVTVDSAGRHMENMASVEAGNSLCTFGATQAGINADFGDEPRNYIWTVAAKYLGETNQQLPPGGSRYILTIDADAVDPPCAHGAWNTFDKTQNVVTCTDESPLVMPWSPPDKTAAAHFLDGMLVPTPESVTVTEVAPRCGKVSFSGASMANLFSLGTGRLLWAENGTVSLNKIFVSD